MPKGRKTLTENPGPPSMGVGQEANYLLPPKKPKVTETMENLQSNLGGAEIADSGTMTTLGESLREAQRPTRSLANPKTTSTIGHWNVRTMYRGGAAAEIAREMDGYNLDVLGISECRWTKAGKTILGSGQTLIYSGNEVKH